MAGQRGGINFAGWAIGIAVLLLVVIPLFLCLVVVPLAGIFSGGK